MCQCESIPKPEEWQRRNSKGSEGLLDATEKVGISSKDARDTTVSELHDAFEEGMEIVMEGNLELKVQIFEGHTDRFWGLATPHTSSLVLANRGSISMTTVELGLKGSVAISSAQEPDALATKMGIGGCVWTIEQSIGSQ